MDAINFLTVIIFVGKLQEKVPLSYDQHGRVFLISVCFSSFADFIEDNYCIVARSANCG